MAIAQTTHQIPQPTVAERLRYQPATAQNSSHALKIVDSFEPRFEHDNWVPGHGARVAEAARSTGYSGPIVVQQNPMPENLANFLTLSRGQMALPDQSSEQVLGLLDQHVQMDSQSLMLQATQSLAQDIQAGVTGAVTNFSLGAGSSGATDNLYRDIRLGWTPPQPGEPEGSEVRRHIGTGLMNNLARAWNIPVTDLTSEDPAVHGPARAKFQQNLIDRVHSAEQSPDVQKVHKFYGQAVDAYEAKGNSVVISAGNEGFLLDQMKIDNGGHSLKAPKDFQKNALATDSTTVVGASGVRDFDAQGKPVYGVAPYSNQEGVSVYASGDLPWGQGTSFAAPRVAAKMTELHQAHPRLTSSQIENLARQQLSDQPLPPGFSEVR